MANEPNGPYRKGYIAFGYIDIDTREAAIANAAWRAGRASRDRLREALADAGDTIQSVLDGYDLDRDSGWTKKALADLQEALAEDENNEAKTT